MKAERQRLAITNDLISTCARNSHLITGGDDADAGDDDNDDDDGDDDET